MPNRRWRWKGAPDWRSHEERIAPPPDRLGGVVWLRHQGIELFLSRNEHVRLAVIAIKSEVGLRYCLIVGMGFARTRRPRKMVAHVQHRRLVARLGQRFGCGHVSGIERRKGPIAAEVGLGAREFPVAHFAHGRGNGGTPELGRQIRQRRRVVQRVARSCIRGGTGRRHRRRSGLAVQAG